MPSLIEQLVARVKALFKRVGFRPEYEAAMHAAIGVSGEAGELLDVVKNSWAYGKPVDRENVIEELGDIEFYLEALRQDLRITREETLEANGRKLANRYPQGEYTDADAQTRADKQ